VVAGLVPAAVVVVDPLAGDAAAVRGAPVVVRAGCVVVAVPAEAGAGVVLDEVVDVELVRCGAAASGIG